MNSYRSSSEETDDEEMEDDNSIFDRPVRDLLYQKVQRLEREEGHQMGGAATCPRNDSNFSYGRRVPRHVKEQEWNLSSLIQAQEEQRSLECYEINIDPIVRHKLAKLLLLNGVLLDRNPGVYKQLLNYPRAEVELRGDIAKDVDRTFIEYRLFSNGNKGQGMLYRVLAAYAVYNPEIGYCQGMNVLASVLLLARFSEEETFWALTRLMKEYSIEQMFLPGLPGVRRSIEKFNELFEFLLPKLAKHFAKEGIESTMYLSKWFMTLYGSVLPLELVFKVWEEFLATGSWSVLWAVGLSLLHLFEDELLKRPFEGILLFIQSLPLEKLDEGAVLDQTAVFRKQIREAKWVQESLFALLA